MDILSRKTRVRVFFKLLPGENGMKSSVVLFLLANLFFSCQSNRSGKGDVVPDSPRVKTSADTTTIKSDSHYLWSAELLPGEGLVVKKSNPISRDSLTADNILQVLNVMYPKIPVQFVRTVNDTLYVRILNSTYLTQKIGSSGAQAYLAELTYNLTEVPGINYVDVRFKAGDHASPATYTRTDFVRMKK
jgi:hypothetical protein